MTSSSRHLVVAGSTLFVAAALGFVAVAAPVNDAIEALQKQGRDLDRDIEATQVRIDALEPLAGGTALAQGIGWSGATRAAAEYEMQTRILKLAEQTELRLSAFGPTPPPSNLTLPAVGYQIEGEGAWSHVFEYVDALERASPALSVADLTLRSLPGDGGQARVVFRATVWGMAPDMADSE